MINLTKKKVSWPAEQEVIPASALLEILASAVSPSLSQHTEEDDLIFHLNFVKYEKSIKDAVAFGELPILDATTWEILPPHASLECAVVRVTDVKRYLEKIGSVVNLVIEPARKKIQWKPNAHAIKLSTLVAQLAQLVCGVPPDPDDEEETCLDYEDDYSRHLEKFESLIDAAVRWGELPIRDAQTMERLNHEQTDNAVVSIDDLQKYLKRSNSEIELVSSVNTSPPMQSSGDCEDVSRYTSAEEMHRYQQRLVQLADDHVAEQEVFCGRGIGLEVAGTSPLAMEYEESGGLPNALPPGLTTAPRPLQRSAAQDAKILTALKRAGHDPKALPNPGRGRPGAKAQAKQALKNDPLFVGTTVFDKAWERLRAEGAIADAC